MKKILLIITSFITVTAFSQIGEDTKKLGSLIQSLSSNIDNPQKIDSLIVEAESLYINSTNALVKTTTKDFISTAKDSRNISFTSKPLRQNFESLDKDFQKKFSYEFDKFKNVGFINTKRANVGNIKTYISVKDNKARLRFVIKYYGSAWLFFNKAIFIIDGKNYEFEDNNTKREISSGSNVEEKSDLAVDKNILEILEAISNSKDVVEYRLTGDKYSDFKLTEKEKENIISILDLYKRLTN